MNYLSTLPLLGGKGDKKGLLSRDVASGIKLLAFVWVDRDRRYFISTAGSLANGRPCVRDRWTQVDTTPNAPPVLKTIIIPQPKAAETYYKACAKIDQHNRCRQASLQLEKKIHTHDWSRRVNMSLFGITIVDAWLLAQGSWGTEHGLNTPQRLFYEKLAEELIDNDFDSRTLRRRHREVSPSDASTRTATSSIISIPGCKRGLSVAIDSVNQMCAPTPTKKMKKKNPKHRHQGRCSVCNALTTCVCRQCQQQEPATDSAKQHWICNKPGKVCMGHHILAKHPTSDATKVKVELDFESLW